MVELRTILRNSILVGPLVWGLSSPALANDIIDDCNQTCEASCPEPPVDCRNPVGGSNECLLGADVFCSASEGPIILKDTTDLNLRGHEITCTDAVKCDYNAIEFAGTNNQVTSDGTHDTTDPEAVISGPFTTGVHCFSKTGSIVEHVTIKHVLTGIEDCKKTRQNVISDAQRLLLGFVNYGIRTGGVGTSGNLIDDNYVADRAQAIITDSTKTINVRGNVIHRAIIAIDLGVGQSSNKGNVDSNILFSTGTGDPNDIFGGGILIQTSATDNGSYQDNFCDEDHADCPTCISDDRCEPYTSPFMGP